jgi:hypothetical protein
MRKGKRVARESRGVFLGKSEREKAIESCGTQKEKEKDRKRKKEGRAIESDGETRGDRGGG